MKPTRTCFELTTAPECFLQPAESRTHMPATTLNFLIDISFRNESRDNTTISDAYESEIFGKISALILVRQATAEIRPKRFPGEHYFAENRQQSFSPDRISSASTRTSWFGGA